MELTILSQIKAVAEASQAPSMEESGTTPVGLESDHEAQYKDRLWALRNGLEKLDNAAESSSVVRFFVELTQEQGGRLVLLRRKQNKMRILLAEGLSFPAKYLSRDSDTSSFLSCRKDDVFETASRERVVYHGRVPCGYFPEDFETLIAGDVDRSILIVPLPLRARWNTFIYLDWPGVDASDRAAEAACLARYALLRLICLDAGNLPLGQLIRKISHTEEKPQESIEKTKSLQFRPGDLPPEKILAEAGELMAVPQVALHILDLLRDPGTTADLLEKEIIKDQVLTGRLLRVANSSYYEGITEARTVRDAIVRLGFKNVRNWTLVTASRTAFPDIDSRQSLYRIWHQSMISALGCQIVSDFREYHDREMVFVGGLMQNIGLLILARAKPEIYASLNTLAVERKQKMWEIEQEYLGYDHGELGALLIRDWNLGEELENAVRYHHRLNEDNGQGTMSAMIALGEEIGFSCKLDPEALKVQFITSVAAARLGLSWENYCEMAGNLSKQDHEIGL